MFTLFLLFVAEKVYLDKGGNQCESRAKKTARLGLSFVYFNGTFNEERTQIGVCLCVYAGLFLQVIGICQRQLKLP